jgi:predicted aminopeptidase
MTQDQLIARQAQQIEELRDEVSALKARISKARGYIYCIGGPLNDNKLGYTKAQMWTFFRIAEELGDD